jgi:hypothetical protein
MTYYVGIIYKKLIKFIKAKYGGSAIVINISTALCVQSPTTRTITLLVENGIYNTCSKDIKTTLYHCQLMFCQHNRCDTNCTQPCHKNYISNNLLPQYHIQNPIIQNPNLNLPLQIDYEKPTPMPKHIYTRLNEYPIDQILNIKETTRKGRYTPIQ